MSGITCSLCGQTLPPAGPDPRDVALVEYEAALVDWSRTHAAAIWDSKHQPEHAAACKRLRAATATVRALAREAAAVEPAGGPCQAPVPCDCRDYLPDLSDLAFERCERDLAGHDLAYAPDRPVDCLIVADGRCPSQTVDGLTGNATRCKLPAGHADPDHTDGAMTWRTIPTFADEEAT